VREKCEDCGKWSNDLPNHQANTCKERVKVRTPLARTGIKRKPAKKKSPHKKAKDAAWTAFSRYIRLRDAIRTTGAIHSCICVTCGKTKPTFGKGCIHAGHWLGGRKGKNLFEERAVWGQCAGCNLFGAGQNIPYTAWMTENIGHAEMDRIVLQANTPYKYTVDELVAIRAEYEAKAEELT
jgi:hypothetical protein